MVSAPVGVLRQMVWEQKAAKIMGIDWRSALYCLEAIPDADGVVVLAKESGMQELRLPAWFRLRQSYYSWLENELQNWDLVLLRHSLYDPFQVRFLKKYGHKVFLIHHTKELQELLADGLSLVAGAKVILEYLYGRRSIKLAQGVIGVTPEIRDYELKRISSSVENKPTFVYPNGIYMSERNSGNEGSRGNIPEFLFVASYFSPWHGLDLLLDEVSRNTSPFVLHLVGGLSDADRERAGSDSRVKIHGFLSESEIDLLANKSWVGLSSFALNRAGLEQACTLKVREYLAYGLPVYAGYLEVFPKNFSYYRVGPPDINKIINYAMEVKRVDRAKVRDSARPLISKQVLVDALYADLCGSGIKR